MTATTSIEVAGVKDALRALNKIDKVARREVTKDYKQIVSSVVDEARASTPSEPPLSGMRRAWRARSGAVTIFPWNDSASDRTIKPFVSGKRPREYGGFTSDLAAFGIGWSDPAAQTVEFAGRGRTVTRKGLQMAAALDAKYPGRFLWKAYERHADRVQEEVRQLINRVMRRVQKDI